VALLLAALSLPDVAWAQAAVPGAVTASAPTPSPAASAISPPATASVHRCETGGRVTFQQAPCPAGQAGRVVTVAPANVVTSAVPPAAAASAALAAPAAPAQPAAGLLPPAAPAVSDELACLAYLKPLLRDPASGRVLTSRREGRVLLVQLQAADARARVQTREAACEFVNGRVDDGWSRIQLKRLGWFAPRVLVQGTGVEARRAARALEESIEALP